MRTFAEFELLRTRAQDQTELDRPHPKNWLSSNEVPQVEIDLRGPRRLPLEQAMAEPRRCIEARRDAIDPPNWCAVLGEAFDPLAQDSNGRSCGDGNKNQPGKAL